jgi:hypothetical protein
MKKAAILALTVVSSFACSALPGVDVPTMPSSPIELAHAKRTGCQVHLSTIVKGFSEGRRVAVAVLEGSCAGGLVTWRVEPAQAAAWTFAYPNYEALLNGPALPLDTPSRYVQVQQLAYTGPQCVYATVVGSGERAAVSLNGPSDLTCRLR